MLCRKKRTKRAKGKKRSLISAITKGCANHVVRHSSLLGHEKNNQSRYLSVGQSVCQSWAGTDSVKRFRCKSSTKYLIMFGAILKASILSKNYCGYFLGYSWKNWATIGKIGLFFLVTLAGCYLHCQGTYKVPVSFSKIFNASTLWLTSQVRS